MKMLNVGDSVQIQGCSTKKRILETSSGCDSFDTICGGALVNSSIVLIDEPRSRHYSSYLIKYFLAEGVHNNHKCLIVDPCNSDIETTVLKSIPVRKSQNSTETSKNFNEFPPENEMKIAWRYGNVAKVESGLSSSSKNENLYDFSKFVENPQNVEIFDGSSLEKLYQRILEIVNEGEVHTKSTGRGGPKKNLLRIVIKNIDSALWEDADINIWKFLTLLRNMQKNCYAIVYLTTNSACLEDEEFARFEQLADTHVQLIQFDEAEKKTFRHLGNTHGYFHLKKLPRLASVGMHNPPVLDLVFEAQTRKGFQIKIMHLPPALDDSTAPQNTQKSTPCGIDF